MSIFSNFAFLDESHKHKLHTLQQALWLILTWFVVKTQLFLDLGFPLNILMKTLNRSITLNTVTHFQFVALKDNSYHHWLCLIICLFQKYFPDRNKKNKTKSKVKNPIQYDGSLIALRSLVIDIQNTVLLLRKHKPTFKEKFSG